MKIFTRYQSCLLAVLIALPLTAFGSDVTLPHTFQAGDPARASEVNSNFSAIKSAVDDNNTGIIANDGRITANSNAVADNAAAISANSAGIAANASQIGGNSARILDLEQNGFTPPRPPVIGSVSIEGITDPIDLYGLDFSIISLTDATTGTPNGIPNFSPLALTIDYRADVAGLYMNAVQGLSIPHVVISTLPDKNTGAGTLTITLTDALVKSLSPDNNQNNGSGTRGSLHLLYKSIEIASERNIVNYNLATRTPSSTLSCRDESVPFELFAPIDPGNPSNISLTDFHFDFLLNTEGSGPTGGSDTTRTGLSFQPTDYDLLTCLFIEATAAAPLRFLVNTYDNANNGNKPAFTYELTPFVLPSFSIKSDNQGNINAEVSLHLQMVRITANRLDSTGAIIEAFLYEWAFHTGPI